MLLELLLTTILWTGIDNNKNAELKVTCDTVELHYGGKPTARDIPVVFWMEDLRYKHVYLYAVPMKVTQTGAIKLEPTEFWIEEIRQQKSLKLRVDNKDYIFDLTGTKELINCGDVAQ